MKEQNTEERERKETETEEKKRKAIVSGRNIFNNLAYNLFLKESTNLDCIPSDVLLRLHVTYYILNKTERELLNSLIALIDEEKIHQWLLKHPYDGFHTSEAVNEHTEKNIVAHRKWSPALGTEITDQLYKVWLPTEEFKKSPCYNLDRDSDAPLIYKIHWIIFFCTSYDKAYCRKLRKLYPEVIVRTPVWNTASATKIINDFLNHTQNSERLISLLQPWLKK
jgi:hypothetical protein